MLESMRDNSLSQSAAEGCEARIMQNKKAALLSDAFLWGAIGSMGLALALQARGRRHLGLFIGQCASPLLILGLYDKLSKLADKNRTDHNARAKYWDREAAAETIVEPEAHFSHAGVPLLEDDELTPYQGYLENEFGVHSVSDYPHDERLPTFPK